MPRRTTSKVVPVGATRGLAQLLREMKRRKLTQSELTVMVDDITRDLGKRTTRAEINHVMMGRRRATNLMAIAFQELLRIPVRAWYEASS